MSREIEIDPVFFVVFDAWFNCDVIDLSNADAIRDATNACACDAIGQISDLDTLISGLSAVLGRWNHHDVLQFINATDTDWLFDERTEQILKGAIADIVKELKDYRLNFKQWLNNEPASLSAQ
jgi:hypothetical protein